MLAAEQAVQRARRVVDEFEEVVSSALWVLDEASSTQPSPGSALLAASIWRRPPSTSAGCGPAAENSQTWPTSSEFLSWDDPRRNGGFGNIGAPGLPMLET